MSYKAIVASIASTREIEGADNIQIGVCSGYEVIIGKGYVAGDQGIFFEAGGQLSEEFVKQHDLVTRRDEKGNKIGGGSFAKNRRIKAMRLRGVRSEGFWMPVSAVNYCGRVKLTEGQEFDSINGHFICDRYVTVAQEGWSRTRKVSRGETDMFRKQLDMNQLRRGASEIVDRSIVYITEKLHGTSFRYGRVLRSSNNIGRFFLRLVGQEWVYMHGSKNIILDKSTKGSWYGSESFRREAMEGVDLRKGEVLYGEIVGWYRNKQNQPALIMGAQSTSKLQELTKVYGPEMVYDYGLREGQCKPYIYRIVIHDQEDNAIELSWFQVQKRCEELGLEPVPVLMTMVLNHEEGNAQIERLESYVDTLVNGSDGLGVPSTLTPSHIMEGVVLRCESAGRTLFLKHKSWVFGVMEGYLRDDARFVDREEVS